MREFVIKIWAEVMGMRSQGVWSHWRQIARRLLWLRNCGPRTKTLAEPFSGSTKRMQAGKCVSRPTTMAPSKNEMRLTRSIAFLSGLCNLRRDSRDLIQVFCFCVSLSNYLILYAVRVVSEASRPLDLSRTSCSLSRKSVILVDRFCPTADVLHPL
jgi:hypothetical protein